MNLQKSAFTLVELIVTIIILAILGTISFISFQGYTKTSRDSVRIADISTMETSLELFHLDSGKYPNTTSGYDVLYSGSTVWTQGVFGENTKNNVVKLDKVPTDPLTMKEYTYSITKTKQEYQLAGLMENSGISLATLDSNVYAGELVATAMVAGNYNGQILKAQIGVNCEILSLPTIISGEGETETDLVNILTNQNLVYNGYNNLPGNYKGSKYKTDDGFKFTSKKLVVYSDTKECAPLYDGTNPLARINLIKNLKKAYSGTIIENASRINRLVNIDVNDTESINVLSASVINNNLGGKIISSEAETITCEDGYTYKDGECVIILPSCESGYSYNTVSDKCEINPACATGYSFNTTRDKCEVVYTCSSGYTYNTSTKLCAKIQTVAATTGAPVNCKGKFQGSDKRGALVGSGLSCVAPKNGQCSYNGSRYAIKFNANCVIERWSRDNNWRRKTVAIGSYGLYTSSYDRREYAFNQTVGSYSCPSGYTLSGTTCSRTLTTAPTCSNSGVLNTTINLCQLDSSCSSGGILNLSTNKCELDAQCDNGLLDSSLDACVEN